MRFLFFTAFLFGVFSLVGQDISNGLVAHYSFDDCMDLGKDDSGNNTAAVIQGSPECVCGVNGNAILLDGIDDYLIFLGSISNSFNTVDFTVSLYIKPTNPVGIQDIISRREACTDNRAFSLTYTAGANFVDALLSQSDSIQNRLRARVPFESCWTHLVFLRRGSRSQLYIDGELADERTANRRISIDNNADLNIANGECVGITTNRFTGMIDELRVYDRALRLEEIRALYFSPDRILTNDVILFLGESVEVEIGESCATSYAWTPTTGVTDPSRAITSISPPQAGTFTYRLNFSDEFCTASDTLRVTVIDPNELPCVAQLPGAFTPNADNLNDTYGISNATVLKDKLIEFEIYDRWGGRIFSTTDAFERWDGTFNGTELNPGVLLYRVRYLCGEEEKLDMGSLTLLR